MIPPWWGIPVILVVGIAVVWFGWWHDRRRAQRAATALREPPPRPIPGLDDSPQPTYTTDEDLRAASRPQADPDLLGRRPGSPSLPAGTHDAFLDASGLATLRDSLVLVTDAEITEDRLLVSILQRARRDARPLVIVAPAFSPDVLGTLLANALSGRVASLPVASGGADQRQRAATLTGASVVDADDLAADFLPPQVWGSCRGWISDTTTSWVVRA